MSDKTESSDKTVMLVFKEHGSSNFREWIEALKVDLSKRSGPVSEFIRSILELDHDK